MTELHTWRRNGCIGAAPAADEAEWEKKFHLLPNIEEWKERLYTRQGRPA